METNEIVKLKKRNRFLVVTALSMTVAWLLFFVYAFVQSGITKEKEKLVVSTLIQLEERQKRANFNEQRAIAAEHKAIMQMENKEKAMAKH